jgi:hypothetical protein
MLHKWKVVHIVTSKPNSDSHDTLARTDDWTCRMQYIDASFPSNFNNICVSETNTVLFNFAKIEWFTPKCEVHIGEALDL